MPKWMLYALLTVLFWGWWGFISRRVGDSLSGEQSQVISTLGLLPILIALGCSPRRLTGFRKLRGCLVAFAGGLIAALGNLAFYQLMHAGQRAATAVPLTALYPMVTVALAFVVLKERFNRVQTGGITLALAAIYLFNVSREGHVLSGWLAYALVPIALWGLAGLLQKLCTNDISSELSTLCFLAALVPVALAILVMQPMRWQLPAELWLWGSALGLFLGLGNLTLLAAFANEGKAAIIMPLSGLYSVVTVPLAVWLLKERVTAREWAAIGLALAAAVALSYERPAHNGRSAKA